MASIAALVFTARARTPPFRIEDGRIIAVSIAEERRIHLGGAEHYALIRGRDSAASVLVFIHGGPG